MLARESLAAHEVSTNNSHPTFPCLRDQRDRNISFRTGDYVPLDSIGKHYGVYGAYSLPWHQQAAQTRAT